MVLVEPEIPPNTGNIGRLCLATGCRLHLVEPLGFSLEEKQLRRAGLDYWRDVDKRLWPSLDALRSAAGGEARFWFFTTKVQQTFWEVGYADGDYLVFGKETEGLPEPLLEAEGERGVTIPMRCGSARSLNLSTSVGIAVYEALRQLS